LSSRRPTSITFGDTWDEKWLFSKNLQKVDIQVRCWTIPGSISQGIGLKVWNVRVLGRVEVRVFRLSLKGAITVSRQHPLSKIVSWRCSFYENNFVSFTFCFVSHCAQVF
jgi:hypothetical protein